MFCENPIRAVYVKIADLWHDNAYLDCYRELAYHFTGGFGVVMLTERDYLRFHRGGVVKAPIAEALLEELGREYDPCIEEKAGHAPWIYFEHTLFCGERITSVEHREETGEILVRFEDFDFRFIPHDSEEEFPVRGHDLADYNRVLGCERYLRNRCPACGGEGEILSDYIDDYLVRCSSCKRATGTKVFVQYAIDEWNAGRLSHTVEDGKISNPFS